MRFIRPYLYKQQIVNSVQRSLNDRDSSNSLCASIRALRTTANRLFRLQISWQL